MVTFTLTTANADESDLQGEAFEEEESEEETEESGWESEVYFPADLVIDEYKSQERRAIKKSMVEDPTQRICYHSSWITSSFKRCSLSVLILISK